MKWMEFGIIFLSGFFSCVFLFSFGVSTDLEMPFGFGGGDVDAPSDWVSEEDIIVLDDSIILNIANATVSRYSATGSMRPVLDIGANGIRVVPESEDDVEVGDIITFRSGERQIVHRVVLKGLDSEGVYFVLKGDNNDFDDGKIRFSDIRYKTIGLLY